MLGGPRLKLLLLFSSEQVSVLVGDSDFVGRRRGHHPRVADGTSSLVPASKDGDINNYRQESSFETEEQVDEEFLLDHETATAGPREMDEDINPLSAVEEAGHGLLSVSGAQQVDEDDGPSWPSFLEMELFQEDAYQFGGERLQLYQEGVEDTPPAYALAPLAGASKTFSEDELYEEPMLAVKLRRENEPPWHDWGGGADVVRDVDKNGGAGEYGGAGGNDPDERQQEYGLEGADNLVQRDIPAGEDHGGEDRADKRDREDGEGGFDGYEGRREEGTDDVVEQDHPTIDEAVEKGALENEDGNATFKRVEIVSSQGVILLGRGEEVDRGESEGGGAGREENEGEQDDEMVESKSVRMDPASVNADGSLGLEQEARGEDEHDEPIGNVVPANHAMFGEGRWKDEEADGSDANSSGEHEILEK